MTDKPEFVSIVLPCRNEAKFIASCLDSIVANDYPTERLEILVLDGMSDDGTRDIVEKHANRHPFIRLVDNPRRTAPAALNIGIARARGSVIMRMDAHTVYPANYISGLLAWLEKSGADNVGGAWITHPANDSAVAQAIAIALAHPFGVGNAHFRLGVTEPRWVDTVPFGCYRREVFDRIGMFDEELIRNQDDEFNLRLIKRGGRILLVPDVVSHYYARDSLGKLWRMYYQYGYFKPLVARKVGGVLTVRQAIPPAFVGSLLASGLLTLCWPAAGWLLGGIALAYTGLTVSAAAALSAFRRPKCGPALCVVFPIVHLSYGLGFLKGIFDFLMLRRRPTARRTLLPLSR
jgi:glycosyltransferase involved in cell wall biosynthesis